MKVLIAGATGFTGGFVTDKLTRKGFDVTAFVRSSSKTHHLDALGVNRLVGSLDEPDTLRKALGGMDALVCVASLGFGHAPGIIQACEQAGLPRAVFFSTTGIFTQLNPASKTVRVAAEDTVRGSKIQWTILRPTMIYGTGEDRNMCRLVRFLSKSPVMPVLGPGTHLQQPVHVTDLADAVYRVLATPGTEKNAYNLAGAAPLTFNEVIAATARALGRRVRTLHIPVGPSLAAVKAYNRLVRSPRITVEQVLRLNENKAFSIEAARRDFGYDPIAFESGIEREVRLLSAAPTERERETARV